MDEDREMVKTLNRNEAKTLILSIMVGAVIAPIVLSLTYTIQTVYDLIKIISDLPGGYIWMLVPLLAAGIAVGLLTRKIAPEAEGPGIQVAAAAFNTPETRLRARSGPFKYLATVITMGAGATTGVVSQSSFIGYSIGSATAYRLGLDKGKMKTIALCGMAAGISALLETPMGAAIFAVEVGYRNRILYRRFFYCLASSTTAFLISKVLRPRKPLLDIPGEVPPLTLVDLLTMMLIAMAVTILCIICIIVYQRFHDRFIRMNWKGYGWLKPAFGMLLAAILIIPAYPILLEFGYIAGFSGKLVPLEELDISKLIFTAFVLIISAIIIAASGNSGGLMMPIMAFGAISGVSIASFFTDTDPIIFASVGMAAAISTTLNVPVAAAVICMELFGLPVFLPSILGGIAGYFIGKRYVIYHEIQWASLRERTSV